MKRFIAILSAAAVLSGTVSCGSKTESSESRKVTEDGRPVLTIAMPETSYEFISPLAEFERLHPEIEVNIVDYSRLSGSDPVTLLKQNIAEGKIPDMIIADPGLISELEKKDMFADMYGLMDQYGGLSREDFLPNILSGFEVDGQLPAVSAGFKVTTAAAKTSLVGDAQNWTLERFEEIYSGLSDHMTLWLEQGGNPRIAYHYITKKAADDCIDLENGSCNFTGGTFAKALSLSMDIQRQNDMFLLAEGSTEGEISDYQQQVQNAFINDSTLVNVIHIDSVNENTGNSIFRTFGGEDITFVGFPSDSGCGAYTECTGLMAIPEKSSMKETAWEFVKYAVTDRTLRQKQSGNSIPVYRPYFEECFDPEGTFTEHNISESKSFDGEKTIPEKAVRQLYNYLTGLEFAPYHDKTASDIIHEESAAVLAGERSPEECAELIQSRVSIYLSENS